jgi:hypothetical protein
MSCYSQADYITDLLIGDELESLKSYLNSHKPSKEVCDEAMKLTDGFATNNDSDTDLAFLKYYVDTFGKSLNAEKDAQLAEKDAQLAEKDAQLAEKDAQLAEKDAQLAEKNKLILQCSQLPFDECAKLKNIELTYRTHYNDTLVKLCSYGILDEHLKSIIQTSKIEIDNDTLEKLSSKLRTLEGVKFDNKKTVLNAIIARADNENNIEGLIQFAALNEFTDYKSLADYYTCDHMIAYYIEDNPDAVNNVRRFLKYVGYNTFEREFDLASAKYLIAKYEN